MAIDVLEANTVSKGMQIAKLILEQVKPVIDALNVVYDSQGGVKETLTQAELDSVSSYSGLTKTQLDDGMYVLTSTLRQAIANGYAQLIQLAARA